MALKSLSLFMISTLLLASSSLSSVFAGFGGRKVLVTSADSVALPPSFGHFDFVFLNPKDPKVIDLAKYAIDEYNKGDHPKLVFYRVFEATYTNNENGTNYRIFVAATIETFWLYKKELNAYEVEILVGKDDKKVLSAFTKVE